MSMSFKRNDIQEFIEYDIGCMDLSKWRNYCTNLEKWEITSSNIARLINCKNSDIQSYYIKAVQTFSQALNNIDSQNFSWAIVKIYYSMFYLLRCEILLANYVLVKNGTLFLQK